MHTWVPWAGAPLGTLVTLGWLTMAHTGTWVVPHWCWCTTIRVGRKLSSPENSSNADSQDSFHGILLKITPSV